MADLVTDGVLNAANVEAALTDHAAALDKMYMCISGFLVFLMQAGFAMLTAGSVRTKNVKNVLIKNVLDACVGALSYYLFGYMFAYGTSKATNAFIGFGQFALTGTNTNYAEFFFQWAFAATAATIVSGSVAERTSFYAYLGYAFLLTGFVYPVVTHWVWTGDGFLAKLGMVDFAGCAVVHMVGGIAGLVGAIMVGPRIGRFADGKVQPMPGHSATLATLGTFLLWFGWYGFNPGSALAITGGAYKVVERCAVTTTLGAAAGGVVTLIVRKATDHIFDLIAVLNGVLAGLVAVTASCAFIEPYAAVAIGAIGACIYIATCEVLLKMQIDDPLEAFPIHGATGLWGVIANGLFARPDLGANGLFYGGGAKLLGVNILGALIISAWTAVLIGALFAGLKAASLLRISAEEEEAGNDVSKHGGDAYAFAEKMKA